jgi:hypothetical protein
MYTFARVEAQSQPQGRAPSKAQPVGGKAEDTPQLLTIELANELGVKATVHVAELTSGKDTWGDREHDFITDELNSIGGEWAAQPRTNIRN